MGRVEPLVIQAADQPRDGWDDPVKGRVGWRTLFSGGTTATDALTAGLADLEPGDWLGLHRHAPAEIYYVLEGKGILIIDKAEHQVGPGSAVFIPGDAEHGIRNSGENVLRFVYVFPTDSFADVEYRFS